MAACIYKVLTTSAEPQEHTLEHKSRLCGACNFSNMLHPASGFPRKKLRQTTTVGHAERGLVKQEQINAKL